MANGLIVRPLPMEAVSPSHVAAGFPGANLANDYAGVIWRSSVIESYLNILIDLGSDQRIDTAMLFGCQGMPANAVLQVFGATAAQGSSFATYSYNSAGEPFWAGTAMPTSGRGVSLWHDRAARTTPCRYWLLQLTGVAGLQISAARVVIGAALTLERNFGNGGATGVRDLGSLDYSARGVMLRRRAARLRTLALTFSSIRKDELEAQVSPLLEYVGNTELVAIVTDPAVDPQRQNRCWLGPLVGDLSAVRRNAAAYETKIALVSNF